MPGRSSYSYEDLLACGRGEMFGPGEPKLPLPPMLMFDRITEITEGGGKYGRGLVRAELDIKPDLWFFQCHLERSGDARLSWSRWALADGGILSGLAWPRPECAGSCPRSRRFEI